MPAVTGEYCIKEGMLSARIGGAISPSGGFAGGCCPAKMDMPLDINCQEYMEQLTGNSKVRHQWRQRGFSCGIWTDPPGQVWENYVHEVDELFMVIEGEIELEIEGRRLYPKPGEEVFIPANAIHSVRNIGQTTCRWFYGYRE